MPRRIPSPSISGHCTEWHSSNTHLEGTWFEPQLETTYSTFIFRGFRHGDALDLLLAQRLGTKNYNRWAGLSLLIGDNRWLQYRVVVSAMSDYLRDLCSDDVVAAPAVLNGSSQDGIYFNVISNRSLCQVKRGKWWLISEIRQGRWMGSTEQIMFTAPAGLNTSCIVSRLC
jgi:hypothetical protein